MKRGPQVYDLPVAHLDQEVGHYIPPRTHDEQEAVRRRSQPAGTLQLEQQTDGLLITGRMFDLIGSDDEVYDYLTRRLASACLNSAWHNYASLQSAGSLVTLDNVGRRRLDLPKHAVIDDEGEVYYETSARNRVSLRAGLANAALFAEKLERAHRFLFESSERTLRRKLGRVTGNIGLMMAATPLIGERGAPAVIQTNVRAAGIRAIEASRETYEGTYPTVAQLSDLDSQLSVGIRRDNTAPASVTPILLQATDDIRRRRRDLHAA